MSEHREFDEFIDESRARQRNIVFPDTVRNARSVDAFFWHGSPSPTLVQRIAAWMFGVVDIGCGLVFVTFAIHEAHASDRSWGVVGVFTLIALSFCLLGLRMFRNGFPRPQKVPKDERAG
jgi:hypothetical protein